MSVEGARRASIVALGLASAAALTAVLTFAPRADAADNWPDVKGRQDRAVLMCRFPDSPTPSIKTKAYFQGMFGPGKGLSGYYDEVSYGAIDFSPTVYDWKTLAHNRAYYGIDENQSTGGQNSDLMFDDCVGAHDSEVDFSKVEGIDLIFDEAYDFGPSLGGTRYTSIDGVEKRWPYTSVASIYDQAGDQQEDEALWAHEIGHSFGLPHTTAKNGLAHTWDPMGFTCGWGFFEGKFDPDYQCLPEQYLAAHKDLLGWIPSKRRFTLTPQKKAKKATRKITLERAAKPGANKNPLIARFPVKGTPKPTYYTAEARMQVGNFDSAVNLPSDGVLVTKVVINCQGTPQCQYDYTPTEVQGVNHDTSGNEASFLDASSLYTRGETFKAGKLKIKVTRKLTKGYKLTVTNRK